MVMMNYLLGVIMVFVIFGVMALGVVSAPYQGVVALMGVSFFCCIFMVALGRTFAALVMYIVYLGGLIVVFSYCVSVEKDKEDAFKVGGSKFLIIFMLVLVVFFVWLVLVGGVGGILVYTNWEDLVCLEVNGSAVFYSGGGAGLMICSWGLLVVLFSILVILSWSRLGGLRPF